MDVNALLVDMGGNTLASSRGIREAEIGIEVVSDIFLSDVIAARLHLRKPACSRSRALADGCRATRQHPGARAVPAPPANALTDRRLGAHAGHHPRFECRRDQGPVCTGRTRRRAFQWPWSCFRGVELGRVRSSLERILRQQQPRHQDLPGFRIPLWSHSAQGSVPEAGATEDPAGVARGDQGRGSPGRHGPVGARCHPRRHGHCKKHC